MDDAKIELKLPKDAIDYYNKKFEEKLFELKPPQVKKKESPKETSISHSFIHTIDAKDIIDSTMILCEVDGFGEKKAQYFNTKGNKPIGLCDRSFQEVSKFVKELSGKKPFIRTISENFIHDTVFEWLKEKYDGKISYEEKFCEYLIKKTQSAINKYEVRCPIEFLSIEKQFSLGMVNFNFFTEEEIGDIEYKHIEAGKNKKEKDEIKRNFERIRKRYQGKVYASLFITAEINKAIELAKIETDKALMVLRFFSPSSLFLNDRQYFDRMGQTKVPSSYIFIYKSNKPIISESADSSMGINYHIGIKELNEANKAGLLKFSKLLEKEKLTEFEETFLLGTSYFTKGAFVRESVDKLVFLFQSAETLLIQDTNEPIIDNIARRLAFITERTAEKRKEAISLIKLAYKQRSKYLHHGLKKIDLDQVEFVQQKIWTALLYLLINKDKYNNKVELISDIETQILS